MPESPSRKTADLKLAIDAASRSSGVAASPTRKANAQAGRIMYIECKAGGLTGPARIGRVTFKNGTHALLSWPNLPEPQGSWVQVQLLLRGDRRGLLDLWSQAPGGDALYGSALIEIVREEYWRDIRRQLDRVDEPVV